MSPKAVSEGPAVGWYSEGGRFGHDPVLKKIRGYSACCNPSSL